MSSDGESKRSVIGPFENAISNSYDAALSDARRISHTTRSSCLSRNQHMLADKQEHRKWVLQERRVIPAGARERGPPSVCARARPAHTRTRAHHSGMM